LSKGPLPSRGIGPSGEFISQEGGKDEEENKKEGKRTLKHTVKNAACLCCFFREGKKKPSFEFMSKIRKALKSLSKEEEEMNCTGEGRLFPWNKGKKPDVLVGATGKEGDGLGVFVY